jgi:farnesyl-diphosphate farnesyltransferase
LSQSALQNECWGFCAGILPAVSRSFALIIPQCPEPIDRALCVAYLICRLADTVEDELALADSQRSLLYDALLAAVDRPEEASLSESFVRAWPAVPADDYGRLVEGAALVVGAFASLPAEIRSPIRACVHDMIAGMRQTRVVLNREGVAFFCADMADLERYCHHVAGTVGIMSTVLFETRLKPAGFGVTDQWRENGRRLGLGLQMTNIIKDCRVDAGRGVSFIPAEYVEFGPTGYSLGREARAKLIGRCIEHLDAGLRYSLALPHTEGGIRTFLLGSLLPAIATLEVAAPGAELHPKIERAKMHEIFDCIRDNLDNDAALQAWYDDHRQRTLATINPAPAGGTGSLPARAF